MELEQAWLSIVVSWPMYTQRNSWMGQDTWVYTELIVRVWNSVAVDGAWTKVVVWP